MSAALVVALVAAGCSPPPETEPSPGAPSPAAVAGSPSTTLGSVPASEECSGIGPAPSSAQITYLSGSLVYQMLPDGSDLTCLVRAERPLTLAWSSPGDRLLLGGLQTFLPSGDRPMVQEQVRSPRWSAPTGKATIHISIDQTKLLKVPAQGGPATDISFLERHDEAVYHPAGTHIAVAGLSREGVYGIFLATNTGTDPQTLVFGETAEVISSLVYDESGEFLYFAADHGRHHHLHLLSRPGVETYAETAEPISRIVQSNGRLAFRQGACDTGTKAIVRRFNRQPDGSSELVGVPQVAPFVEPAGWLPDGSLLLIARQSECDEAGDLHVWSGSGSPKLLAQNVDRVAIRAVAQQPPPPPPIPGAGWPDKGTRQGPVGPANLPEPFG